MNQIASSYFHRGGKIPLTGLTIPEFFLSIVNRFPEQEAVVSLPQQRRQWTMPGLAHRRCILPKRTNWSLMSFMASRSPHGSNFTKMKPCPPRKYVNSANTILPILKSPNTSNSSKSSRWQHRTSCKSLKCTRRWSNTCNRVKKIYPRYTVSLALISTSSALLQQRLCLCNIALPTWIKCQAVFICTKMRMYWNGCNDFVQTEVDFMSHLDQHQPVTPYGFFWPQTE